MKYHNECNKELLRKLFLRERVEKPMIYMYKVRWLGVIVKEYLITKNIPKSQLKDWELAEPAPLPLTHTDVEVYRFIWLYHSDNTGVGCVHSGNC